MERNVSESQQTLIRDLVLPLLGIWLHRDERKAAKDAGSLMFWDDGMLRQLRDIAGGKATDATFKQLGDNFRQTDEPVNETMKRLRTARDKLSGTPVARQIDRVMNSRQGKFAVRENIERIVEMHNALKKQNGHDQSTLDFIVMAADEACRDIGALNAELERLNRVVNGM
jgi:hypothetical protein